MAGRTRLVLLDAGAVFAALINRPDGPEIHDEESETLTFGARSGRDRTGREVEGLGRQAAFRVEPP